MSDVRYTVTYIYDDGMECCITTTDKDRVLEAYKYGESDSEIVTVTIGMEEFTDE